MDNKTVRVVRLATLKDFQKEVPSGVVRLLSSKTGVPSSALPQYRFALSLQGVNAEGEIVWLEESHIAMVDYDGKGFGADNASILEGVHALADIVREYLLAAGYEVRDGDYGLPDTIKPLRAHFECAKWEKVNEYEWQVTKG